LYALKEFHDEANMIAIKNNWLKGLNNSLTTLIS